MTREEAVTKLEQAIWKTRREHLGEGMDTWVHGFINQVEALGLIRFEEPGEVFPVWWFEPGRAVPPNAEGGEQPSPEFKAKVSERQAILDVLDSSEEALILDALEVASRRLRLIPLNTDFANTDRAIAILAVLTEHGFTIARKP